MSINGSYVATVSLLSLTIFSGIILSSSYVSADDSVVDQINITVPVSCSLSGTGQNSHNAEIVNGTYESNIGTTTLSAFCNDSEGFAIYAAGYTGNEIGGTNSNKLVGTSASNNAAIETGLATSAGNPDISNWAMKLAITQDSGDTSGTNAFAIDSAPNVELPSQAEQGATEASFANYHVVPNEYTKVAHKNSNTDMTASTGGVKLTTTYAAYISKTQAADTYSGQVIYTLVHPSSADAPLLCNPSGMTIAAIVCMQDINATNKSSILASMTEDAEYQLYDSRDKKQYYVAKLRDGNIWMTQNLDLDIDSSVTYTSEDTDLPFGTTWTPDASTYQTGDTTWDTFSSVEYYNEDIEDYTTDNYETSESYDPGDLYWVGFDSSYSWKNNYSTCENMDDCTAFSTSGNRHYHLGNYYDFGAALAVNDASYYINQSSLVLIDQSICPAGWTLPRAGEGNDTFYNLVSNYANINSFYHDEDYDLLIDDPLYLTIAGQWNGNQQAWIRGPVETHSWTSVTYIYGGTAYDMDIEYGSTFNPARYYDYHLRWANGATIRCIARPVTNTIQGLD